MRNYKIISDTSVNLPDELIEKYQLQMLPLSFIVDGVPHDSYNFEEKRFADYKHYYNLMREGAVIKTSCINPGFAREFFLDMLAKEKCDIVYIGFSSGLSNSFDVVRSVAKEISDQSEYEIHCIDTRAASLGQGSIVVNALEKKLSGATIKELIEYVESIKLKTVHLFTVDDLIYLHRGGRVTRASYFIAKTLKIKPILHMLEDGKISGLTKMIGRKKTIYQLAVKLSETIINPEEQIIYISHGDCYEEAIFLKEQILKFVKVKDIVINYVDIVIGSHSGPGTLAVFYHAKQRV